MKRKLLIALIAITAALCGAFGFAACGDKDGGGNNGGNGESGTSSDGQLTYKLNDDNESYSVVGVQDGKASEIIIPAEYSGKPVTGIGEYAFSSCSEYLKTVTMPNSILTVDKYAFSWSSVFETLVFDGDLGEWCRIEGIANLPSGVKINEQYLRAMTEIVIPDGATIIRGNAFDSCHAVSVTVPDSVTIIENNAFQYCEELKTIKIGDGLTSIGEQAFNGCSAFETATVPAIACSHIGKGNLKSVTVTSGESIGDYAFDNCILLENVSLPESLKSIGERAFANCPLKSIIIPNSVEKIGEYAFDNCPIETAELPSSACKYINNTNLKTVTITSGESLENEAFNNCGSLENITLSESVTKILERAFVDCHIKNVILSDSVKIIDKYAFNHCDIENLTVIGSSIEIDKDAFSYCSIVCAEVPAFACANISNSNLKTLEITGDGSIDTSLFINCNVLESISVNEENTDYSSQDGILYDKTKTQILLVPKAIKGKVNIPDSLTSLSVSAFVERNDLVFNEYDNAYYLGNEKTPYLVLVKAKSKDITSCNIHESVKFVQCNAFENCTLLVSVIIPDGIKNIANNMFKGCTALISVKIPDSVENILYNAFEGCSSLSDVSIGKGVTHIYGEAFKNCSKLTEITIPENVISIADSNEVTHIYGAFSGCPIEKATVPAFACKSIKNSKLKTVTITSGDSLDEKSFYYCTSLISVTFDGVKTIGVSAFENCTSLVNIEIPDSVEKIDKRAFYGCLALTGVTIPDSVTSIGDYAFSYCSSVANITVPDSVHSIGKGAFEGCSKLAAITLPFVGAEQKCYALNKTHFGYIFGANTEKENSNFVPSSLKSVTVYGDNIYNNAFSSCSSIKAVTILEGVTSIGNDAFKDCKSLTEIKFNDFATYCQMNRLENLDKSKVYVGGQKLSEMTEIVLPDEITKITQNAFSGCTLLKKIKFSNFANYCKVNGLENLDKSKVYIGEEQLSEITEAVISDEITEINQKIFNGCSALKSVTVGKSVRSIGINVFKNCTLLEEIKFADFESYLGIDGLNNSDKSMVFIGGQKLMEMTSIVIPDGVTSIGGEAFRSCGSLISVTIPDSVTSIGDAAFSDCSSLSSVTMGNGVTNIGRGAFYNCISLTNVSLGNSVTTIDMFAFSYCSSLTTITIPVSVTYIGYQAFFESWSVTVIIFEGTKEQWNAIEKDDNWNINMNRYTVRCTDGDIIK